MIIYIYIYIYSYHIYIYIYTYIHVYTYLYRERERVIIIIISSTISPKVPEHAPESGGGPGGAALSGPEGCTGAPEG